MRAARPRWTRQARRARVGGIVIRNVWPRLPIGAVTPPDPLRERAAGVEEAVRFMGQRQGWPRRAEAPGRASRLASRAERSASAPRRLTRTLCPAAPRRRRGGARAGAALKLVDLSEQVMAKCSGTEAAQNLHSQFHHCEIKKYSVKT